MSLASRASRHRTLIAAVALAAALAGCGAGEPRSVAPSGVDGLEIPTPSPRPRDFVAVVDNPYLPLVAGSRWTYRNQTDPDEITTVSVNENTRTIAGVPATAVTTTLSGGRGQGAGVDQASIDYFAQDRDGNVWSFGSDDWLAGVDGAQAGLVMPATPRVGDGFRQQYAPGVAEDLSQVLDVAGERMTPYGSWTAVVEVLDTSSVAGQTGESVTRRFYAPGVGLVQSETTSATIELVSYEAPETR